MSDIGRRIISGLADLRNRLRDGRGISGLRRNRYRPCIVCDMPVSNDGYLCEKCLILDGKARADIDAGRVFPLSDEEKKQ